MPKILVVDDEPAIREALRGILLRQGYVVAEAGSVREALAQADPADAPDAALVDLRLPDGEGTEVLEKFKARGLPTTVVLISGHGTIAAAVAAVRGGAFDFLEKPLDRDRTLITVRNAVHQTSLMSRVSQSGESFLTESKIMREVLDEARRLAASPAPILVQGETGSGKEVLARWIHRTGPQAGGPFVALNCAALPENLAESELFGHVKGAFTGAESARKGKFQAADGGTLFLDEVGDLPAPIQAKLLRALEEGAVEPVGSDRTVPVKVRVIAATHRDLQAKVRDGGFREDLLFRIAGLPLRIPALRQRPEDVSLLGQRFLDEARVRQGWAAEPMGKAFRESLLSHAWPGNVRELRWAVERAALLAGPAMPGPEHLPPEVRLPESARPDGPLTSARRDAEARAIAEALTQTGGNVAAAAKMLGLSRSRLYEKLGELELDAASFRRRPRSKR